MKAVSGKQLARILDGNRPLKVGLLRHLLKMAGLAESDLEV